MPPEYAHLTFFTYEPRTRDVIDEWKKYIGICSRGFTEATVQISDQLKHYSLIYSIANIKRAHFGALLYNITKKRTLEQELYPSTWGQILHLENLK